MILTVKYPDYFPVMKEGTVSVPPAAVKRHQGPCTELGTSSVMSAPPSPRRLAAEPHSPVFPPAPALQHAAVDCPACNARSGCQAIGRPRAPQHVMSSMLAIYQELLSLKFVKDEALSKAAWAPGVEAYKVWGLWHLLGGQAIDSR